MEGKVNLRDSGHSCLRSKSDRVYHMVYPYVHMLPGESGRIGKAGWLIDGMVGVTLT